jgi:hypothetical protein
VNMCRHAPSCAVMRRPSPTPRPADQSP